jgi:hypothetical protein
MSDIYVETLLLSCLSNLRKPIYGNKRKGNYGKGNTEQHIIDLNAKQRDYKKNNANQT